MPQRRRDRERDVPADWRGRHGQVPDATRIAVFGSYARGEETPGSDVDILVELRAPGRRPFLGLNWFKLEEDLGARLGRPLELVTLEALSPYVRPYVQRDEVELYAEG